MTVSSVPWSYQFQPSLDHLFPLICHLWTTIEPTRIIQPELADSIYPSNAWSLRDWSPSLQGVVQLAGPGSAAVLRSCNDFGFPGLLEPLPPPGAVFPQQKLGQGWAMSHE